MADDSAYYVNTDTRSVIKKNDHPDAQWFPKAGFGIFLHWGISTVDGGIDLSWGMFKNCPYGGDTITPDDYFSLAERFNPEKWDPNKILKAAKDAGMRYAVLTTRHHDSYALWPSEYGEYNTGFYMGGRDLVAEYVEACRNNGLKVGFYYSPPDFYSPRKYLTYWGWQEGKPVPAVMENYVRAIGRGQVHELLTRYGKVDLIWFDGNGFELMSDEEMRALQPGIVIGRGEGTDFDSLECQLPTQKKYEEKLKGVWWECCHEMNSSWAYRIYDEWHMKPLDELINMIETVRKYNGNLLLNIGPDSHGELPKIAYERLAELGAYIKSRPGLLPEWDED